MRRCIGRCCGQQNSVGKALRLLDRISEITAKWLSSGVAGKAHLQRRMARRRADKWQKILLSQSISMQRCLLFAHPPLRVDQTELHQLGRYAVFGEVNPKAAHTDFVQSFNRFLEFGPRWVLGDAS